MAQAWGAVDYAENYECNHRHWQKWEIIPWLDGTSRIKNFQTKTCLAPLGVNNQTQYNCTDNDPSLNWILIPTNNPGNKTSTTTTSKGFLKHLPKQYFYSKLLNLLSELLPSISGLIIKNQETGKCLSIEGIGDWHPIQTINCDALTGKWDYDEGKKLRV